MGVLKELGLVVKSENPAVPGREEDILCIQGPADKMSAIQALTKSKMI